jgi:aerobic-type carbon monoxide dehydrogenase small subunit (CoxS/CutS family)
MANAIDLNVNGVSHHIDSAPWRTLLDVLREDLGLTGCKIGCGEGACGACTVLVDRQTTRTCITAVEDAVGRSILTIEGLEVNGQLHPLQQAFLDADAMQCGYCTPGMIMAALGLLLEQPNPTEQAIVEAMNGNICRCGAYSRIVGAIQQAAATVRGIHE